MKIFKTISLTLCLCLATCLGTINAQTKKNANFDAGIAAIEANNMPLAYKKFLAAAKEGHIDSQYNVALMYEKGMGVPKNLKEALIWYNKAAEQGNSNAQFNLGVLYENGTGTSIDYAKAHKWYRKAILQNDGLAVGNLGMLYLRGQGVKTNKIAGMALLLVSVQMDQSPENNARKNISATRDLTMSMIKEAQTLSDKMNNSKNILLPLDQYLKK
ncbi:tetratricopeptide repeat protein [Flavobacterium adhaerens]|uniref:tetratricopeptide repeat protein n=1 Tax=Flavobacterium adhaerens TaxID=3149043 RepID=UPI0032B5FF33